MEKTIVLFLAISASVAVFHRLPIAVCTLVV
jgi:hypothetical protein